MLPPPSYFFVFQPTTKSAVEFMPLYYHAKRQPVKRIAVKNYFFIKASGGTAGRSFKAKSRITQLPKKLFL